MKKILMITVVMLLLTGCGEKKTKTVCKSSNDGMQLVEEINAKGDKVTVLKETATLDFSDAEVTDNDIDEMGKVLGEGYEGIKGVEYKYTAKDKKIEYTVTFDYENADLDELKEKNLVSFNEEGKAKYISLKESIKGFEDKKFTCK